VLDKANVEKFIDFIVTYVELLQLFEGLDTLDVFELTSTYVKKSNIFERGTDVTEAWYYRIVELQILQAREDFSGDLQIMKLGIHS
jgi:hypothetical protein